MGVALLDVNALLALLIEHHDFHVRMARWFAGHQRSGWATCPITQQGFVRIVSNPAYLKPAPKVASALALLQATVQASAQHEFWNAGFPLSDLESPIKTRLTGHKQITDAYLLTLAIRHKGKLVTFDRRILQLAPEGSVERDSLQILQ
ncbi:MAG: TA system VapC family ribonuclease toxin [Terracidiphilus sp.]